MSDVLIFVLPAWFVMLVINIQIAEAKNLSTGGVAVASLFFGPLAYLYVLGMPVRPPKAPKL